MERTNPLRTLHQHAEAEGMTYPPAGAVFAGAAERTEIVASFGDSIGEYTAMTTGAGLLDLPFRSSLVVTGADRLDFLNRLFTQTLTSLSAGRSTHSFWLNRKGRIEADIRIVHSEDRTILDLDFAVANRVRETLAEFIITEDVELRDTTDELHRLSLIGPRSAELLRRVTAPDDAATLSNHISGRAVEVRIADAPSTAVFEEMFTAPSIELFVPRNEVESTYHQLLEAGFGMNGGTGDCFRAVGFRAVNLLRVESGQPMFLIDFGVESLPHESGVLRDRVAFTKGCYLGQEIVARMESLGQPKQMLVAVQFGVGPTNSSAEESHGNDSAGSGAALVIPIGAELRPADAPEHDAIGIVTSSVRSPRLGGARLVFAAVRTRHAAAGTRLRTAGGEVGVIQRQLRV